MTRITSVIPQTFTEDVLIGHGPDRTVQVPAVHPFRKDPPVILPPGIGCSVDIRVQGLPVILAVQAALRPLPGKGYALRVPFPVCRDVVPVPEAGHGGIALLLQDHPDPVMDAYHLQDAAEPGERDLHEGLVVLFLKVYSLLLPLVVSDDEVGKPSLLHHL